MQMRSYYRYCLIVFLDFFFDLLDVKPMETCFLDADSYGKIRIASDGVISNVRIPCYVKSHRLLFIYFSERE